MPWESRGVMSLREEFLARILAKEKSVSQLCKEYKISRPTAYKWMDRYDKDGLVGLNNRSTRPLHMPTKTEDEFVDIIISIRDEYPAWGAKKLKQVLVNRGHNNLPCLSTFNRILQKYNRINPTEATKRKPFIRFERKNPNELWQMDFKGYFLLNEGTCHPLTVLDDCSRFSICLKACASENEQAVKNALQESFRQYGLPTAMTMDNGSPWKGYPKQRLSSLTVWLMRLGIKVGHSRPNHPQTQGKDERFHRTFKDEVLKYHNFHNLLDAQEHFDVWREIYNNIRPHEAIDMKCPAAQYKISDRKYPEKIPPIEYLPEDKPLKVGNNGEICFQGNRQYVGTCLKGEWVAIREQRNHLDIYYVNTRIGTLKIKT